MLKQLFTYGALIVLFLNLHTLHAQPLIILENGKEYSAILDDVSPYRFSETALNFMHSVRLSYGRESKLINTRPLEIPPLEWGKAVNDSCTGQLRHYRQFPNGFYTEVTLNHLQPDHEYVLTINGRPDLEGNQLLPTPVPGNESERYYDLIRIHTNAAGHYQGTLAVLLPPGAYHTRFYVKDPDDWKIVLYHDYFKFMVE
ncbi:MAG: hypothetical protein JXR22_10170 [Prolixibacteraceae bacterium]|nr:hypothetical protein [Prolixibacteraceae bacterium]